MTCEQVLTLESIPTTTEKESFSGGLVAQGEFLTNVPHRADAELVSGTCLYGPVVEWLHVRAFSISRAQLVLIYSR
jgi:hypothetical protein